MPIYAFFAAERRDKNRHSHDFWEVSYVYEGRGTHYTENSVLPIIEKELLFISPETEHCIVSPSKENGALVRVCNVLIRKEYMDKIIKKYRQIDCFADYDFTQILGKAFCLQLSDDSRIVYNHMMQSLTNITTFRLAAAILLKTA